MCDQQRENGQRGEVGEDEDENEQGGGVKGRGKTEGG